MKKETVFQRYEFKYLLTRGQQARLLSAAGARLRPDEYSHSSIRNLYLDTPDFRLIRRSLEKPVYKEKLRLRSYGRADREHPVFMELKKKYRSIVYKRRLTLPYGRALDCLTGDCPWPETQIGREIGYAMDFSGSGATGVPLLRAGLLVCAGERSAHHLRRRHPLSDSRPDAGLRPVGHSPAEAGSGSDGVKGSWGHPPLDGPPADRDGTL